MKDAFDTKNFRRALGNFATGITVITATAPNGMRAGLTANSFNSVSLDPPLILWSLSKDFTGLEVFEQATHFAVNVLAADQMHLSNQFATPAEDKFAGIDVQEGLGKSLLLNDCAASFECENYQMIDGGDHWIILGKVERFEDAGRQPLCYHQGGYSILLPYSRFSAEDESQQKSVKQIEGRLNNNYFYLMTQAVRSYQASYHPLQLATGLQTNEARLLMVLDQHLELSRSSMSTEVNLPETEIDAATEMLLRKSLLVRNDDSYQITALGKEQANRLWQISEEEQTRVFKDVPAEDLEAFKRVLKTLI